MGNAKSWLDLQIADIGLDGYPDILIAENSENDANWVRGLRIMGSPGK